MTNKKQIKIKLGVPDSFFDFVEELVFAEIDESLVPRYRESMYPAQRKYLMYEFAEEIWNRYQNYLVTKEFKKIPAKQYDYLFKKTLHSVKDSVVLYKKREDERVELPTPEGLKAYAETII